MLDTITVKFVFATLNSDFTWTQRILIKDFVLIHSDPRKEGILDQIVAELKTSKKEVLYSMEVIPVDDNMVWKQPWFSWRMVDDVEIYADKNIFNPDNLTNTNSSERRLLYKGLDIRDKIILTESGDLKVDNSKKHYILEWSEDGDFEEVTYTAMIPVNLVEKYHE